MNISCYHVITNNDLIRSRKEMKNATMVNQVAMTSKVTVITMLSKVNVVKKVRHLRLKDAQILTNRSSVLTSRYSVKTDKKTTVKKNL